MGLSPSGNRYEATTSLPRHSAAMSDDFDHVNEVVLIGRLSGEVNARDLPSGDELVSFRVVVERPDSGVDTIDCVAFRADVRRKVQRWNSGDVLEVHGHLRRRFWRTGNGPASRTEVEITSATRMAALA